MLKPNFTLHFTDLCNNNNTLTSIYYFILMLNATSICLRHKNLLPSVVQALDNVKSKIKLYGTGERSLHFITPFGVILFSDYWKWLLLFLNKDTEFVYC